MFEAGKSPARMVSSGRKRNWRRGLLTHAKGARETLCHVATTAPSSRIQSDSALSVFLVKAWPPLRTALLIAIFSEGPISAQPRDNRSAPASTAHPESAPSVADPQAPAPPAPPGVEERSLRIPKVSRAPKLQDFLTGTPREAEVKVTDFLQNEPRDGVPATQKTAAYLSYDDNNLYVVFECEDDPSKVRGRPAQRDHIEDDDQVLLYLDTFQTRQRAYVFAANPLGVQQDGVINEGAEDPDYSFDALWYSEGQPTPTGYIVWMAIPFKSVRYPNASVQTWGIALGRSVARSSEISFWPYITQRVEGFAQQMGTLEELEHTPAGYRAEFIPYGTFTGSHYLDTNRPAYMSRAQGRVGLDSKFVLKDAFTLDIAANPDFSEVESDDPQVLVNKRYEVQFPEKRPLFLENATFFQTPISLFYSRHIDDPQFGARLTGTVDRWNIGLLAINNRQPGTVIEPSDPLYHHDAIDGVVRIQREFGQQSSIGIFASSRDFGSSSNRVFSLDTRLKLSPNWVFTGQASQTFTRNQDTSQLSGAGYFAQILRHGHHFTSSTTYSDLSPGFRADLGYIQRVDIRQIEQNATYFWRPQKHRIQYFGPSAKALVNWDRKGRVQDWLASLDFIVFVTGQTELRVGRTESFELFAGAISPSAGQNPYDTVDTGTSAGGPLFGFRKHASSVEFSTAWMKWLGVAASYTQGTGVNYSPPSGLAPFHGETREGSAGFALRPSPRLRFDLTYVYSGLVTPPGASPVVPPSAAVYNNHLIRWKTNVQFTRALSLRAIVDYNALLQNPDLLAEEGYKRITGNLLLKYQLHHGTAFYAGYNSQYENIALDPTDPVGLRRTPAPTIPTGRQIFFKLSYLLRF